VVEARTWHFLFLVRLAGHCRQIGHCDGHWTGYRCTYRWRLTMRRRNRSRHWCWRAGTHFTHGYGKRGPWKCEKQNAAAYIMPDWVAEWLVYNNLYTKNITAVDKYYWHSETVCIVFCLSVVLMPVSGNLCADCFITLLILIGLGPRFCRRWIDWGCLARWRSCLLTVSKHRKPIIQKLRSVNNEC